MPSARPAPTTAHQRAGEGDARLASWPGLAERVAEHRRRLGGKWSDLRRVAVPLDARISTRLSANVEEQRCLHALVLASDELSHIELSAIDQNGHILGRAASLGRDRSLVVCSPLSTPVSFELRPLGGRGVAVLVLSQSDPAAPPISTMRCASIVTKVAHWMTRARRTRRVCRASATPKQKC